MKEVKKIVEQRIEKHLDLVDETTDVINTIGTVTSPAVMESQTEDEKADNDLLNSLEIVPDDPYVMNYLAYSWLERNLKINKAIEMLERA